MKTYMCNGTGGGGSRLYMYTVQMSYLDLSRDVRADGG